MFRLELAYTANLEKIQKFLKIVLGVLDMQGTNNLKGNKIPLEKFHDEHISYDEVLAICNKINKEEGRGTIEVLNESFEFKQIKNEPGSEKFQEVFKELNRMECKDSGMEFIPFTKKDIKENIIFKIKDVDRLKELDQETDKAIRVAKPTGGVKEKIESKPKFPYDLPAGTNWDNIVITFVDDENVVISALKKTCKIDFVGMGFMDRRPNIPRPDKNWLFLKILAKHYGEIIIQDKEIDKKYKKQKQLLSDALKYYFTLDYDPFFPYKNYIPDIKNSDSYKIKITLIYPRKDEPEEVKSYLSSTIRTMETPEEELDREMRDYYGDALEGK